MGLLAFGRLSASYSVGGLGYKLVALLSVPLLARVLRPAELGLLDFAGVFATIVAMVVAVGADHAVPYHDSRQRDEAGSVWGTMLAIVVALSFGVVALVSVVAGPLAGAILSEPDGGTVLVAAALYGGVMAITTLALVAIRLYGRPSTYAVVAFLVALTEMGGALTLALILRDPVVPMILVWAAGAAVVSVPALGRHIRGHVGTPTTAVARRLVAFGLPLVSAVAVWLVGDAWIRSTVAREMDPTALGQYGIAHRLAGALGLVVSGVGTAWAPYIYATERDAMHARTGRTAVGAVLGVGVLAALLTAAAPELVAIVAGQEYAGAEAAVPGLAGSMAALAVIVLIAPLVGHGGSTTRIAMAAGFGLLIQVVTVSPLVGGLGLRGAALASVAGYAGAAVVLFLVAAWEVRSQGLARFGVAGLATACGIGLVAMTIEADLLVRLLAVVAVCFALLACFLLLVRRIDPDERPVAQDRA